MASLKLPSPSLLSGVKVNKHNDPVGCAQQSLTFVWCCDVCAVAC
jgi:hypothetical protein